MKAKIKIPKYEDFPEYALEMAKMEKLKENLQTLIAKKIEMSRINAEHDAAVRLRGENIDNLIESGEFEGSDIDSRYSSDEFAKINSQTYMLEQAIEKHQATLDQTKNLVNPKLLKGVAAKYKALVNKIAQAYIDVAKLHEEENEIIYALENAGIRYWGVMPKLHTSNIGAVSDEHAWIHFFLKEAEQQGYLKASDYLK